MATQPAAPADHVTWPSYEEEVVLATIEHGHLLHNMTATREDVLAKAVAAPEGATADPSTPDDRRKH